MENDCLHNEKDILVRVAGDDERAFAVLMDYYTPIVYSHVLSYIKNAFRAEEVTQDIFLQVWKHRNELPDIENFRGYIYVITRNRVISAFRQKIFTWDESEKDELETSMMNPQAAAEFREISEILQNAIDHLPPRRKEVFKMSRFEGQSYDKIALHLGISKSAVNQHIVEALVFLRTFLRNRALSLWFIIFLEVGASIFFK